MIIQLSEYSLTKNRKGKKKSIAHINLQPTDHLIYSNIRGAASTSQKKLNFLNAFSPPSISFLTSLLLSPASPSLFSTS